jgi:prepilin-type N-terminal cleavage/methylation domain-containing protein
MIRRLRERLHSDRGFMLIEMIIVVAIGSVLVTALGSFTVSAMKAGAFTDGQSQTINDARNAMMQLEGEIRSAGGVTWCQPTGSCLQILANTPTGSTQTVKYTYSSSALNRQVYDQDTDTWGTAQVVVQRLQNDASQPVFACDAQSTYLRINIDLRVQPSPSSNPTYDVSTTIRPRNFSQVQGC